MTMTFDEISEFIAEVDVRLRARFPDRATVDGNDDRHLLARTVKLSEEVGELANEVLRSLNDQRSEKLEGFSKDHLAEEVADVIITALLVGRSAGVDIPVALRAKMEKIRNRGGL